MFNKKTVFSILTSLCMVSALAVPAFAAEDAAPNADPAAQTVEAMKCYAVQANEDGTFTLIDENGEEVPFSMQIEQDNDFTENSGEFQNVSISVSSSAQVKADTDAETGAVPYTVNARYEDGADYETPVFTAKFIAQ